MFQRSVNECWLLFDSFWSIDFVLNLFIFTSIDIQAPSQPPPPHQQQPIPPSSLTFLSDFIHRSQEASCKNWLYEQVFLFRFLLVEQLFLCSSYAVSNVQCDLTRSAGARYRDVNSDYINTNQQHYVLYGDRNASIEIPINTNQQPQKEGKQKMIIYVSSWSIVRMLNRWEVNDLFDGSHAWLFIINEWMNLMIDTQRDKYEEYLNHNNFFLLFLFLC